MVESVTYSYTPSNGKAGIVQIKGRRGVKKMNITWTQYRNLVIRGFVGAPTASEVEAIERKLGTILPRDFVEFLKVANGGSTCYSVRVPPPDGEYIGLAALYSTKPGDGGEYPMETFLGEIELSRRTRAIPQAVLPFADDGGGCVFYLDLTPEGQGRVLVFRGGLPDWTGRPSGDAYFQVAGSFVEFIDTLSVEPELAQDMLEDAIAEEDEEELAYVRAALDGGLPGWREKLGSDF